MSYVGQLMFQGRLLKFTVSLYLVYIHLHNTETKRPSWASHALDLKTAESADTVFENG